MKIGFIIQARMSSTRLPNKMAMPFGNETSLLGHIIDRLQINFESYKISVATSTNSKDDKINEICGKYNIPCTRGSETDVASRFIQAAEDLDIDYVIRVCGDNPFLSMDLTRNIIKRCEDDTKKSDYYSYYVNNKVGILTDHGFFCEIFSIKRLQKEWTLMDSYMKEHVTPVFYTKNDMLISKLPYDNHKMKRVRLTIDTIEDYHLCGEVFDLLRGKQQDIDGIIDILRPCHYEIMIDKSKNNIK